jgi:hypothetical protein
MSTALKLYCYNSASDENIPRNNTYSSTLKFSIQNERKLLKTFLLGRLHHLFCEIFHKQIQQYQTNFSMECYAVDSKIIQLLIQGIVETGEYTLEGIAYATRIPFDVIFDAACGNNNQFSMTPWVRIINLYTQVKPDVAQLLFKKLIEVMNTNHLAVSLMLSE